MCSSLFLLQNPDPESSIWASKPKIEQKWQILLIALLCFRISYLRILSWYSCRRDLWRMRPLHWLHLWQKSSSRQHFWCQRPYLRNGQKWQNKGTYGAEMSSLISNEVTKCGKWLLGRFCWKNNQSLPQSYPKKSKNKQSRETHPTPTLEKL